VNIVVICNVLFMSVFYFDSLASYCVCFLSFFIYSALAANKGLINDDVKKSRTLNETASQRYGVPQLPFGITRSVTCYPTDTLP